VSHSSTSNKGILQGLPKKRKTIEITYCYCPSTKLNAKMRKILTRVHILNIELLIKEIKIYL
jgi:hypothetical protein